MECILYTCASWNSKYSVPQVTPLSNYFFVAYFWNWPGENKGWLSQTEQHGNMSKIFHLEKTWEKSRVNFAREGGLVDVPINQSINQPTNESINQSINQSINCRNLFRRVYLKNIVISDCFPTLPNEHYHKDKPIVMIYFFHHSQCPRRHLVHSAFICSHMMMYQNLFCYMLRGEHPFTSHFLGSQPGTRVLMVVS